MCSKWCTFWMCQKARVDRTFLNRRIKFTIIVCFTKFYEGHKDSIEIGQQSCTLEHPFFVNFESFLLIYIIIAKFKRRCGQDLVSTRVSSWLFWTNGVKVSEAIFVANHLHFTSTPDYLHLGICQKDFTHVGEFKNFKSTLY